MSNQEIATMLRNEKWYPMIHVTEVELRTSELLNKILEDVALKVEAQ